jgi:hypothetical protein
MCRIDYKDEKMIYTTYDPAKTTSREANKGISSEKI